MWFGLGLYLIYFCLANLADVLCVSDERKCHWFNSETTCVVSGQQHFRRRSGRAGRHLTRWAADLGLVLVFLCSLFCCYVSSHNQETHSLGYWKLWLWTHKCLPTCSPTGLHFSLLVCRTATELKARGKRNPTFASFAVVETHDFWSRASVRIVQHRYYLFH